MEGVFTDLSNLPLRGIIRGNVIELLQSPNLPDGQEVAVTLETTSASDFPPGEGLRQSYGSWAEDAEELDRYLEWNRQQRKISRRPIEP
jgi:hypothetical protein